MADGTPINVGRTHDEYMGKMPMVKVGNQSSYFLSLRFNPIVTIGSALLIAFFIIWCAWDPDFMVEGDDGANAKLKEGQAWIAEHFTWLYIGSQNIWLVFLVYIYIKFGNVRFGKDDEKPEFSDMSWFAMLFAAGIGVGLITYGVSETIWHYTSATRYVDENELKRAQESINLTIFHWGIHGWIVYAIVGASLSIVAYKWDLPLTLRSCFYPILGDRVFGICGDIIDIISVGTTMFGVCTSLGLGADVINTGLHRLNDDIDVDNDNKSLIIWVITLIATASVLTGLRYGIKTLSEICFYLGNFLLMSTLFLDDTWYLLNVMTQSIGFYFQWIIQLGWWCDAFLQSAGYGGFNGALNYGEGTTTGLAMGVGSVEEVEKQAKYLEWWTIFYWGWWISWAPFVGMFIAKISRGRTLGEFVQGVMTAPLVYTFAWFCVFGGAGLRMERRAAASGIDDNCGTFQTADDGGQVMRLSCRGGADMWYDVVSQPDYDLPEDLMVLISLVTIILYFVTSSDSGSLVIDCLCSNGVKEPPAPQRIFWALMEGACATALLNSGEGQDGLKAVQAASICAGLPYTIIICFMCTALHRALLYEAGRLKGGNFKSDLFEPVLGGLGDAGRCSQCQPIQKQIAFLLGLACPAIVYLKVSRQFLGNLRAIALSVIMLVCNGCLVIMILAGIATDKGEDGHGVWALGWVFYFGIAGPWTGLRATIRAEKNIVGNYLEDFFACFLMLPFAVAQINSQANEDAISYPDGSPSKVSSADMQDGL